MLHNSFVIQIFFSKLEVLKKKIELQKDHKKDEYYEKTHFL